MTKRKKTKTKRKLAHPKLPMQGQLNLRDEGTHFNLRLIFEGLNQRYFRGRLSGEWKAQLAKYVPIVVFYPPVVGHDDCPFLTVMKFTRITR